MTASRHSVTMPAWPALLDLEMACAYVGLGEHSFRALAASYQVAPVDMAPLRTVRWRRADLDRMIDSLPSRADPRASESTTAPVQDPQAEALARVRARAAGSQRH